MKKEMKQRTVVKQGYKPIDPVSCGGENCAPRHAYGPATRGHYLLHFVVSGKGIFRTARGEYTLQAGQIFVIKPYEITYYEADANDPWSYLWLGFTSQMELPPELSASDVLSAPELRELFCAAQDDAPFEEGDVSGAYECYLCGIVWQIIGLLRRRTPPLTHAAERYVTPAIGIMRAEHQHAIGVEEIAARLHVNRSYFSEIFRAVTGMSPRQYLHEVRMERAAALLRTHGLGVAVSALSVGYADVCSFSRAFKAYYGMSPSEYAKKSCG